MLKVLIPEKIPAHNKGEEAIFRGILRTLDFVPDRHVYLYSANPDYEVGVYGRDAELITETFLPDTEKPKSQKLAHILKAVPLHAVYALLRRLSPGITRKLFRGKLWRVYDEADVVIAGHDSAYSIMHNLLILFCRAIGKPIVIYGTSALPFLHERRFVRRLSRFCLNRANLITAREEVSYRTLLEKVGVKASGVNLTADKAFLLEPVAAQEGKARLESYGVGVGKSPIIGITAVHRTGIFNTVSFDIETHISVFAQLVDFIVETTGAQVVFFPHSIGPDEANDDRIAARAIFEKCNVKDNVCLIEDDFPVAELKGMIGCCDFFIGERTHSVIGAVSMLVPAISISHPDDYRTVGILGKTAQIGRWIHDIRGLSGDSIKQFFNDAWACRKETRELLQRTIPEAANEAMRNGSLLKELLISEGLFTENRTVAEHGATGEPAGGIGTTS